MKLLIIDDHPIVRIALAGQMSYALGLKIDSIEEAGNLEEALPILRNDVRQWLVVLDLMLPGTSGVDAIHALRAEPNVDHVVVVSSIEDAPTRERLLRAGAAAFIGKSSPPHRLLSACRALVMPPGFDDIDNSLRPQLTPRQLDVMRCIARGMSNKAIAAKLRISDQTVKIHVTQILRTLNASNRTRALIVAAQFGLLR